MEIKGSERRMSQCSKNLPNSNRFLSVLGLFGMVTYLYPFNKSLLKGLVSLNLYAW